MVSFSGPLIFHGSDQYIKCLINLTNPVTLALGLHFSPNHTNTAVFSMSPACGLTTKQNCPAGWVWPLDHLVSSVAGEEEDSASCKCRTQGWSLPPSAQQFLPVGWSPECLLNIFWSLECLLIFCWSLCHSLVRMAGCTACLCCGEGERRKSSAGDRVTQGSPCRQVLLRAVVLSCTEQVRVHGQSFPAVLTVSSFLDFLPKRGFKM